jgi:transposase
VFAIEGAGSFGVGLTRLLQRESERVLKVGRLRRERRSSGKTDALDAVRAARSVLAQTKLVEPRAGGERETLRVATVQKPRTRTLVACWRRKSRVGLGAAARAASLPQSARPQRQSMLRSPQAVLTSPEPAV